MIDLHCHSTASDGTFTPSELIDLAIEKNIASIALTDHDTTSGLAEFHQHAKASGTDIETISGVELAVSWYSSSIHMTGLFIDPTSDFLQNYLVKVRESRYIRNEKTIEKLNKLGIQISLEDWNKQAGNEVAGRPHLAQILVNRGLYSDVKMVFSELLGTNKPGFVSRYRPMPQEGIKAIHEAGGLAFWAHPCAMRNVPYSTIKKIGGNLKGLGLDGLETHYAHFTPQEQVNTTRFAKQYNLLQSGGSDFHGSIKPGLDLGTGLGDGFCVPDSFIDAMKEKLASNKK